MKAIITNPLDQSNLKSYDLDKDVYIITDESLLQDRCDEIDVRKQGKAVQGIVLKLKTLIRENNLTSLSAPEIGYNCRIFCINYNGDIRTYINPVITQAKGLELSRETCPCIPDKEYIRPRNNDISITYITPTGKIESKRLVGLSAIVFQHALDHLDGLLISDVGMQVDSEYDSATDEEKINLINSYLDSLDIKKKELDKQISDDKTLTELSQSIKFLESLQKGEVKTEQMKVSVLRESQGKQSDKDKAKEE